ncbi:uncharacterized protein LODBEIA_P35350 [Lodderomyces beijingensis]|uniref:Alcohol acetyltransferase n=1 Tax=Lodderomyces beijingensis TaxID=1775926 RepID=A0ABP0ZMC6_9ASCO
MAIAENVEGLLTTRPLSVVENFFRSRTASGCYRSFQVTATYNRSLKSDLRLFYLALKKTLLDYPILLTNVQFDEDGSCYVYKLLDKMELGGVLEIVEPAGYIDNGVVNEKFFKKINELTFALYVAKPLFKLTLVGDFDLSAAFEHTIADGVVGNYFHEVFLENLALFDSDAKSDLFKEYGITPESLESLDPNTPLFNIHTDAKFIKNSLPPPVDLFLEDMDLDYTCGDDCFFEKVIPPNFPTKWKGRFNALDTHEIAFKLMNFTTEETKAILQKCRDKKVTLTPYLEIIQALTLQPIFGDTEHTTHRFAMAMRRHFTPEKAPPVYRKMLSDPKYKILGTSAHMGFKENLPPITEFSWELVEKINRHLLQGISNTRALNQMKGFKDSADLTHCSNARFFDQNLGFPKADAVKISNLGLVKLPEYDCGSHTWTITNMIFSQDMAPYASEFMLSAITTPIGGLNLLLSYYDFSFEDTEYENFDHFIEMFKKNMINYSQT